MKKISFFVFVFVVVAFSQSWAQAPSDILFVLDASGSMEALVGGKTQMDIAKQSIRETLPGIPPQTPVGLRVYAHRIPKTDKENSCKDTELMVPMEPGTASRIEAAVSPLMPKGYTPIANSLKAAAEDFRGRESQHVVILLSDGEETCGGDPVAEAKSLLAQGFKVTIHTIGFRVDDQTRAQLKSVSDATGGQYYDASDASSLTQNLKAATQKALFLEKPREEGRGQEIRGGSQFAEAVLLKPGVEYHLDHHQRVNEYDYFYVPVKKGQLLTVSAMTLSHGVRVADGHQGVETDSPYNGFRVNDESFKELMHGNLIGKSHGKESKSVAIDKDQKIYVLIGSEYDTVHKEAPFQVDVTDLFDGGSQVDAGNIIAEALPIELGDYPKNYLMKDGDDDWYKLSVKAGDVFELKAMPESTELGLQVEVMDASRVRVAHGGSPNDGAAVKLDTIEIKETGDMFIHVSSYRVSGRQAYSLSIKKKEGVTPSPSVPKVEAQKPLPPPVVKEEIKTPPVAKKEVGEVTSGKLSDNPLFLKILLVLSVGGNFVLGVMLLIAKFKRRP